MQKEKETAAVSLQYYKPRGLIVGKVWRTQRGGDKSQVILRRRF